MVNRVWKNPLIDWYPWSFFLVTIFNAKLKELGIIWNCIHWLNWNLLKQSMLEPKYKENIKKLREMVNDQPMTSREKAVWWTEYVIRHKDANHFKYPGRLTPVYQKYWLDFIAIGFILNRIKSRPNKIIVNHRFQINFYLYYNSRACFSSVWPSLNGVVNVVTYCRFTDK